MTFNALVTAGGFPVTAGTVTFEDGTTPLGSPVSLDASGHAFFATSLLSAGMHTITATYSGYASFLASSGSTSQTVTPAPLTVMANAQTKVYGSAEPALTYAASGFQLNDTADSVLSTASTFATSCPAPASARATDTPKKKHPKQREPRRKNRFPIPFLRKRSNMFDRFGSLAEKVATNVSRRAFLGRLGQGALVLAGAMGAMLAFPGLGQAKGCTGVCGCCYRCSNGTIYVTDCDPQCHCNKQYKGCPYGC